jgi:hypothetical protein
MGRPKQEREPLPTIWDAPDELWAMIEPILADTIRRSGLTSVRRWTPFKRACAPLSFRRLRRLAELSREA